MSGKQRITKIVVIFLTLAMLLSGFIAIYPGNREKLNTSGQVTGTTKEQVNPKAIKSLSKQIKTVESVTNPKAVPVGYKLNIKTGLTGYQRLLEVSLDTKTPQYYKVTVMGKQLVYKPQVKLYAGFIDTTDDTAIKKGVKVELIKAK